MSDELKPDLLKLPVYLLSELFFHSIILFSLCLCGANLCVLCALCGTDAHKQYNTSYLTKSVYFITMLQKRANAMTNLLDTHYPLTDAQIQQYQRDGYIKLKDVFDEATLSHYGDVFMELVQKYNKDNTPLEQRDTYGMAFLQIANLWVSDMRAKTFAFSKRVAQIATELMQVEGVRMYHDQALFKEPSGGFTPWHVDQFYWPLSNSNSVTAWIPLQAVPLNMGPLQFAIGSQTIMEHRNLAISDESERKIGQSLKDFPIDNTDFALGEISFHSGWTFHRAGPNQTDAMRKVMTIIYIEDGMRVARPKNTSQENDHKTWMLGTEIGDVIATELNPVLYHQ